MILVCMDRRDPQPRFKQQYFRGLDFKITGGLQPPLVSYVTKNTLVRRGLRQTKGLN